MMSLCLKIDKVPIVCKKGTGDTQKSSPKTTSPPPASNHKKFCFAKWSLCSGNLRHCQSDEGLKGRNKGTDKVFHLYASRSRKNNSNTPKSSLV